MIRHSLSAGLSALALGSLSLPAVAGTYAAMEDVPVTGGELRLVKSAAVEMDGPEGSVVEATAIGFPLKHTDVKVDISGPMARVEVTQTFDNPFPEPIEAVYVFPLGDEAAVHDYEIQIGDRTIQGLIKRREEARKMYEEAKAEGHTAGLLEQEKPNIFTQSVANIPPGEDVKVRFSYVELLDYEDTGYEFVYPMVVGPRYLPRNTSDPRPIGAAPAGRTPPRGSTTIGYLPPGMRDKHDIDVQVHLDAGVPVHNVRSTSHQVTGGVAGTEDGTAVDIALADGDRIPNKDFILRYETADAQTLVGWLTHRSENDGFFTLIVQPKAEYKTGDITAREVVLLIDRSGSMSGQPLEQARALSSALLQTLTDRDTFNIVAFADGVDQFANKPVPATEANKQAGLEYLGRLRSGGGTEMLNGVARSLRRPPGSDQVRMVYAMTDGYIGNDLEILGAVQKKGGHNRIFPVGIGSAPNRFLLDRLGEVGRGFTTYLPLDQSAEDVAAKLVEKTRYPYLTDIQIDWGKLEANSITPEVIPDVYAGQPLIISGRYDHPGKGTIRVKANRGGREVSVPLEVEMPAHGERQEVAYLWARRRIKELMGLDYGAAAPETVEQITQLGLDFHLVTNWTSFVAIDTERVVDGAGHVRTIQQPVSMPEGTSFNGVFGDPNAGQQQPVAYGSSHGGGGGGHHGGGGGISFGGGGGAVDPLTLGTLFLLLPAAQALRRRRRRRSEEDDQA